MTWDAWLALIATVVFFVTFGSLIYADRIEMKERFAAWFVAYFGIGEYIMHRAEESLDGLIPTGKMAEIEGRLSQLIDEIEEQKEKTQNLAASFEGFIHRQGANIPTTPTPSRD